MARVAIIDDIQETIDLLAPPLIREGHEVLSDVSPVDFERLMAFKPDIITLDLYRRLEAFDRPIRNVEEDIIGFTPLVEMEHYPAINSIPIILLGNCLREQDVPTSVNYDLFLSFPGDVKLYFPKVKELAESVKSRRRISAYVCPQCGSRLTYSRSSTRDEDLFCPRCHTAVAIIDHERCLARDCEGAAIPCTMEQLRPPAPLPLKRPDQWRR